jgi:hydrogenase expression/formation protein HypE
MGNEGKMIAAVAKEQAEKALELIRGAKYGEAAALVGEVTEGVDGHGDLLVRTAIGGIRQLDVLQGEGLPRIC